MSERMRESLSALMDDEADDLELARVLRALDEDDDVSGAWSRYHLASAVLRGGDAAQLAGSAGFTVELDESEAELSDDAVISEDDLAVETVVGDDGQGMRTWTSFAAAAALTLALVLGFQFGDQVDEGTDLASVAGPASAAGGEIRADLRGVRRASDGAVVASRPTGPLLIPGPARPEAVGARSADAAARRQVDVYMLDHAEFSLVNAPAPLVPFARYATFERGN